MPRSRKASAPPLYAVAVLVALLALVLGAPDRSLADDTRADFPPVVANAVVSPTGLPSTGGTVTISADVSDDIGLVSVWAQAWGSDGTFVSVDLTPEPSGGTTHSGSLSIPANFSDQPVTYTVSIHAWDGNGGETIAWPGEVQVDAQPQFDEPPVVSDPSVDPRALPAAGGAVTIQTTATDLRGISEALAVIGLPGGGTAVVALEPISSSRFEGTFLAPANTGAAPQEYAVEVVAYDDIGQQASADAGIFTVAAPPSRPGRRPARCQLAPPCRRDR